VWEWKRNCSRDLRKLEMPRKWDICEGKLQTESRASPWERLCGCSHQGKAVTSHYHVPQRLADMELQDLMFSLLGLGLFLVQSLVSMHLFLPFGMEVFALCHCMLEVFKLFFDFYRGSQLSCFEFQNRLWLRLIFLEKCWNY
jgi:hypothetical protein